MLVFPTYGSLKYEAIDILGPLTNKKIGNKFSAVVTGKLTKTILMPRVTAQLVVTVVLEYWVSPTRFSTKF